MINLIKLEPIHSGNSPKGKLLKSVSKNRPKSVKNINPQFSFVINSQHMLKLQKISIRKPIKLSFDNFKSFSQSSTPKTSCLNQHDQLSFFKNTSNFFNEKLEGLKEKNLSDTLRKKPKSVCYTRKQKVQFQLNKYMQNLYLQVHSQRISVQNPKIQIKQRQSRPYARSLKRCFV